MCLGSLIPLSGCFIGSINESLEEYREITNAVVTFVCTLDKSIFFPVEGIDWNEAEDAQQLVASAFELDVFIESTRSTWLEISTVERTLFDHSFVSVSFTVLICKDRLTCLAIELDLVKNLLKQSILPAGHKLVFAHRAL